MSRILVITFLVLTLISCAVKIPTNDFKSTTVYKLEDNLIYKKQTNIFSAKYQIVNESLTDHYFIFKSYDIYYIFFADGTLKKISFPKNKTLKKENLSAMEGNNGKYFTVHKTKKIEYVEYDIVNNMKSKVKENYSLINDTLLLNYGEKIFIKIEL